MIKHIIQSSGFAARAGLTIASDAIGDVFAGAGGRSVPYAADRFLTAEHLTAMLNQHAVPPLASDSANREVLINAVKPLDIRSTSSNCNNVVVEIEQAAGALLPDQLFIKLPMPDLGTRWFFAVIGSWALESYFCRHVAPHVPLRTPKTFATYSKGSRFFLAQENLHLDPQVQLFTNMQMLNGPDLDIVYRCLDAFAKLHSCHYGLDAQQRSKILPLDHHPFLGKHMRVVSRTLNELGLAPCVRECDDLIPADVVDLYKKTLKNWDTLLAHWFSGPLSLLHGDSHIGNFFVSGEQMGMLDFQAVHWGKGIRDVQYFLIDSLPAEMLAKHEQDFVKYYVERRAAYSSGIDVKNSDFNSTWQDYRGFTYHTLMTIVVSIGFGALNDEHGALMKEVLKRAVAAVQRVDYADWLDQHI